MNKLQATFGHLKTILVHKHWVFYYACKLGIPWQGLWHDMSKFSPVEFWESVKFYQGGKSSPIPEAKKVQGHSLAWQHHKGHNPHHYEYWTDNYDSGTTTIKIPFKYVLEMVADYLAAGRTYWGKEFTLFKEYLWWRNKVNILGGNSLKVHKDTVEMLDYLLWYLAAYDSTGINTFKSIRTSQKYLQARYEK